jgi:hypothetical protein
MDDRLHLFLVHGRLGEVEGEIASPEPGLAIEFQQHGAELIHVDRAWNRAPLEAQLGGHLVIVDRAWRRLEAIVRRPEGTGDLVMRGRVGHGVFPCERRRQSPPIISSKLAR